MRVELHIVQLLKTPLGLLLLMGTSWSQRAFKALCLFTADILRPMLLKLFHFYFLKTVISTIILIKTQFYYLKATVAVPRGFS